MYCQDEKRAGLRGRPSECCDFSCSTVMLFRAYVSVLLGVKRRRRALFANVPKTNVRSRQRCSLSASGPREVHRKAQSTDVPFSQRPLPVRISSLPPTFASANSRDWRSETVHHLQRESSDGS